MSGLTMGHVGAFGPLGPRGDRYGSFGVGDLDPRSSSESYEWAAERWRKDRCSERGASYVNEPPSSGCHFHANMAILAAQQLALVRLGVKGHSVDDVEKAIVAGRGLGGFSPAQLAQALAAGQASAMNSLGIPVAPKAVPRPPAPGSVSEGVLLARLEDKIAALIVARGATPSGSTMLTPEQQTLLARMTAQERSDAARAATLARVRFAQAVQARLRSAQAALPFSRPTAPALSLRPVEPWKPTGILLLGAGVVGTIIYMLGRRR